MRWFRGSTRFIINKGEVRIADILPSKLLTTDWIEVVMVSTVEGMVRPEEINSER